MNPNELQLGKLPPPPKGQVGINPNQFSHLPPPPKGQQGLTLDQIKQTTNQSQPEQPGFLQRVSSNIQQRGENAYGAITGTSPESQGEPSLVRGFQAAAQGGLAITDTLGEAAKSLYSHFMSSPIKGTFGLGPTPQQVVDKVGNIPFVKNYIAGVKERARTPLKGAYNYDTGQGTKMPIQLLADWANQNPEHAKTLISVLKTAKASGDIANPILMAEGITKLGNRVPGLNEDVTKIPGDIKNVVNKINGSTLKTTVENHITSFAKNMGDTTPENIGQLVEGNRTDLVRQLKEQGLNKEASKIAKLDMSNIESPDEYKAIIKDALSEPTKNLQTTTEALNPDLSGKAKINAYKEVASGRGVKSASMFQEQGLSPSERTVNLAKRLSNPTTLSDGTSVDGVTFGKDPIKNLKTVGSSLDNTEKILQSNPGMDAPLNKPTLIDKLEALKEGKPQDFIGDNGKIYDNTIEYGKKVAAAADDTIRGGREARTLFDSEARRKFPTAFKDGFLDTNTPAGNAIKTVRDAFNEHIYETAPTGSDLQSLVGREADLLSARDISAIKAAKLHGTNWLEQFIENNPKTARAIKYTLYAAGAERIIKGVTGVGF